MHFKIVPPTRYLQSIPEGTFVLAQDNWNDFGFQTLYHLHYGAPRGSVNIGPVKILRKGQIAADTQQITSDFDSLDSNFVSVGQNLDYYEHLSELGIAERDLVLASLRDVARDPTLQPTFEKEEGWGTSLFRDQDAEAIQEFLQLARSLVLADYTLLPSEQLKFTFQMTGWTEALEFDFSQIRSSATWFEPAVHLPERLIVLIGRNGSGKSTLLARLARVAHGTATNRKNGLFKDLGNIEPIGIGFPRIVTISYSAFDSFTLPGVPPQAEGQPDEREQIVEDVQRSEGRYIFCGLRDIATELRAQLSETAGSPAFASDRVSNTLLKSVDALAAEFSRTLQLAKRRGREKDFEEAFKVLATDPSFSFWSDEDSLDGLIKRGADQTFLGWSTGQKIVAQISASLIAHITPRSLVLIDEPEMHLHPPLLATLMHVVRSLLTKYKAFGIVATHSPAVLQESLMRDVYVIQRDGPVTQTLRPVLETFGENVGALTSEVFGLNSEVTDFHRILDQLIARYKNLDTIEQQFTPRGMSLQARAYVMSQLSKRDGH